MDQSELLRHLVETMDALGIAYMIAGSQASIYYGEPRFTQDIDIVADIHESHLRDILGVLRISSAAIDRTYVAKWAARLGLGTTWESLQRQAPPSKEA